LKAVKYVNKENYMSRQIALRLRKVSLLTKAVVLGSVGMLPALLPASVGAAPAITSRTLSSTTAVPGQATDLTWTFNTTADAGNANTIEIEFCDAPLGACNTVNTPTLSNTPTATLGGPWTTTAVTSTALDATSDSGGANTQYTITKTNNDDASTKTALTISFGATDITNNAAANKSYYTRVRIYDSNPTLKWEGVFAQSTSQTLTVNARVQERLDFCVGSTTVDSATVSPGADCAAVTGSSVDIGNIESGFTNVSPVTPTNGGDSNNGVAMIRTNAVNGAVVEYKSLQDNGSGALKVPGATCNAVPSTAGTDQCFNTAAAQGAFTAGTEMFGMTIAGINCGSTSAYTCDFANDAYNLRRNAAYDGNGTTGVGTTTFGAESSDQVSGTTAAGYAWQASGVATTIASSTSSTVKVLDDEAMILKFAATSGITTPTGSYTVQADFIATATF
jgi:hypothetical protein